MANELDRKGLLDALNAAERRRQRGANEAITAVLSDRSTKDRQGALISAACTVGLLALIFGSLIFSEAVSAIEGSVVIAAFLGGWLGTGATYGRLRAYAASIGKLEALIVESHAEFSAGLEAQRELLDASREKLRALGWTPERS